MIKKLEKLPYFTLNQFSLFYKNKKSASIVISNKLRQKKIHNIREGIYISDEKLKEISLSNKITSFKEFIATHLIYTPSYLSLEYVLFENNVITENVYTFTLVTTNKTATFKNNFGTFRYKSIKKTFFGEYNTILIGDFIIYKAIPEKALFDYFYFQRGFIFKEDYIKELRLNLENIDLKLFEKIINKYKSQKVKKIFNIIKKMQGL
ncbi:MAG TPA: hypothetical protein P5060_04055 [Candidatus Absconditabacterales bacterium]|nr:hypothetical protein [Candidatus Absconditabacterales bacterium]